MQTAKANENIWTIPEAASGAATLGLYADGSYGYQSKDQNGNSVAEVYIAGSSRTYSASGASGATFIDVQGINNHVSASAGSHIAVVVTGNSLVATGSQIQLAANTWTSNIAGNNNVISGMAGATGVLVGMAGIGDIVNLSYNALHLDHGVVGSPKLTKVKCA